MAKGHFELLRDLFRPRIVKIGAGLTSSLFVYDALSNQFELPKLGRLLGMSGNLLPWWGWLLILQAILVYALFEYVRRRVQPEGAIPIATGAAPLVTGEEIRKLSLSVSGLAGVASDNQARVDQIEQRIPSFDVRERFERLEKVLADKVSAFGAEARVATRTIEKVEGLLAEQKDRIASSLHAIYVREKIAILSRGIREDAAHLTGRVEKGEAHDAASWDSWDSIHSHWNGLMAQWWTVARFYLANSRQVLLVPRNMYARTKVDESLLIPAGGAEAVRVYKEFKIVQEQWEAVQAQLDDNMCSVAFHGLTEEEVRHGQPLEQG